MLDWGESLDSVKAPLVHMNGDAIICLSARLADRQGGFNITYIITLGDVQCGNITSFVRHIHMYTVRYPSSNHIISALLQTIIISQMGKQKSNQ